MSELLLTLRQPAQIGDKARSDFVLGTHHYLPGAVVRGAFAAAWIAVHGAPAASSATRPQFLRLFEGEVRYGPLFGGSEFVPLSVVSHKYQAAPDCPVVEYDRALQDDVPARCPECESPLEHPKGQRGGTIGVRRRTSVAIAASGVARRGQIVTRDTLEAGQSFRGNLVASDRGLLDALAGLDQIRVGGRRTTHGAAKVQIRDGLPPPTAQRRDDGLLVLRLRSPGVFADQQGRPARAPDPGELQDTLGCAARVVRRWARWHAAGGWHVASGLPKPVELAVAPGSTYLIETTETVTDEALATLGRRGLGLRRHEGFGDLAPPPVLAPGRLARDAEDRRLRALLDVAAPLRGLAVTRPRIWQPLLDRLIAHAQGDPSATQFLRGMAQQLDQSTASALTSYLSLTPSDAAYVARELSSL
jgi:CRISPR-associated protein Csx10